VQQQSDWEGKFKAQDYTGAQEAARKVTGGGYAQVRSTLESIARSLDKEGEKAAKGGGTRRFRRVGEMSLEEDTPRKGDPQKAAAYQKAAKELRDLAAGLR
jgi:hypothetical protein